MNELENRITELEAKIAFQDDTIETLNDELKTHQQRMAKMQRQIELLAEKIKEGKDPGMMPQHQEPPPPHY
ncbi:MULTISPECIES: SlyX family protein [unclassified Pseudoalteromonas]|uniref:SlyX family protein n=1 Tax=unclassified Pseudoalteromonas TaxID=194690 RepID=UPI003014C76E